MNGRGRNGKHMSSIENVEIFEDTKRLCETNGRIKDTLARSVKNQKLIPEGMELPVVHKTRFADEAKIVVSTKRTFEAAAGLCRPEGGSRGMQGSPMEPDIPVLLLRFSLKCLLSQCLIFKSNSTNLKLLYSILIHQ